MTYGAPQGKFAKRKGKDKDKHQTAETEDTGYWWVRCNECDEETNADLNDCECDKCGALDWSDPYREE